MYVLGHQVGTLLVGDTAVLPPLPFGRFSNLGAAFFVGNLIVAVAVTAVSYLTIRLAVSRRHQPLPQEIQA